MIIDVIYTYTPTEVTVRVINLTTGKESTSTLVQGNTSKESTLVQGNTSKERRLVQGKESTLAQGNTSKESTLLQETRERRAP